MWTSKISISMQRKDKNRFIQNCNTEWIGFVDDEVSTEEELRGLLEENPFLEEYDVLLFGDNVPEGECTFGELLASPECVIYALFFRKSLLIYTGAFNSLLAGGESYEMLLRLAEKGSVYSIPCAAQKPADFAPVTMAYIIRRYLNVLKEYNLLDEYFLQIFQMAESQNKSEDFKLAVDTFLNKEDEYEKFVADTAPWLILVANDDCHGVVTEFGRMLADALVSLGQAVITTNDRYGDYKSLSAEDLVQQVYKAIIGFQSPAFEKPLFSAMKGKKYQFWFDNPIFSIEHFAAIPKHMHVLCHDGDYVRYMREHYMLNNAMQFPLAGETGEIFRGEESYDLVFVGTYLTCAETDYKDEFQNRFYQYMITHPRSTVEEGIRAIWDEQGIAYDESLFLETVISLWGVCYDLLKNYRHQVIETILGAGIQMHVFGNTWKVYNGPGKENLVCHPEVCGDEALEVWSKAKIGLNIMNGHKHGMTERIANIMLCGACCLSDETSYLKENFREGEEIMLFDADKLEELPGKIKYLLEHDEERRSIAEAGQKKAQSEHTWRKRAEQLLKMTSEE